MLRQQTEETASPLAEQERVTPEELSRALASIETCRQAEAARLAGTIPINQAVSELHLDSTSDEIWAEVQAQRAKADTAQHQQGQQEQAAQEAREGRRAARRAARQEQSVRLRPVAPRTRGRRGWTRLLVPAVVVWVLVQNGVIPRFWHHAAPVAAPILQPLAQVPDGKEVYADDSALVQVSEGKPEAQINVSANASGNRWAMVKIGAHVYLRGYTASAPSLQPLRGKPLNVYNDDNAGELQGERTTSITLRVDKVPLQKSGGNDGFSEVTVPNFQPDSLTTLSPWH